MSDMKEDLDERRMFDHQVSLYDNDPLRAIAGALSTMSMALPAQGSFAKTLAIHSNEIAKAAAERDRLRAAIPSPCDGKEQDAFEAWGRANGLDIDNQHPLHWLFLDPKTAAARDGWRAALAYVARVTNANPIPPE